MSEIKSTLDLVMERTKHMFQSDEEKQHGKQNELSAQAKGLALRLQEGQIKVEEMMSALRDAEEADRPALKKALIDALVQGISLHESNESIFEGLDALTGGARRNDIAALKSMVTAYLDDKVKLAESTRGTALRDLANLGISGSAVSPNLEMYPSYFQEINELEQKTRGQLAQQAAKIA